METNKPQKNKTKKLRIIESPAPTKLNTNNKTAKIPKKRKLNIIESPLPKSDEIGIKTDIKITEEKKHMSIRLNETNIGLMEE